MTQDLIIQQIKSKHNILHTVDMQPCYSMTYAESQDWIENVCKQVYQSEYLNNDRIVFLHTHGDIYVKNNKLGLLLRTLQISLNEADISNYFVIIVSSNPELDQELELIKQLSTDKVAVTSFQTTGQWNKTIINRYPSSVKELYKYDSVNPLKISLENLSDKEKFLLTESQVFCMYPWVHLNANPDGQAYPCCMTEHNAPVGNTKLNSLKEIWNQEPMKKIRTDMLTEQKISGCNRCYEQEASGFFSGRQSANKHHGHHIEKILDTKSDGSVDQFEMAYWDIRFSNLCNLRCRSCGHVYSSQWYQDQAKIAGPDWAKKNQVLNYAGQHETDMWEQLSQHLDYVEQIYFAGGEPLIMIEHYNILEELDKRKRYDVRLIYNTNFTEIKLKNRTVFDYWKKFDSVSVGASLDAMGARGEYIRKGSDWQQIENNRRLMLESCPQVDFYVSATLSVMNAWHLPDFHRSWVEQGLIKAQDFNVNILLDPSFYRIDIAPNGFKQKLKDKYLAHLEWLKPQDKLGRASKGFESAINLMTATDRSELLPVFWKKIEELDNIRREKLLDAIPELLELK
jgi:radical SAM protein with 4Fe4S-binding SPASM domain